MGGAGVGGYNMINMTITELRTALSRIYSKIGISAGFSLYNINFAERDSEAAMAGDRPLPLAERLGIIRTPVRAGGSKRAGWERRAFWLAPGGASQLRDSAGLANATD